VRCSCTFNDVLPVRAIFTHKVIKNAGVAVNQIFYLQQRRGPINFLLGRKFVHEINARL